MTHEEFDNTRFGFGDKAEYNGIVYEIGSVDFEERLIGLSIVDSDADAENYSWVRCENVKFIPSPTPTPEQ